MDKGMGITCNRCLPISDFHLPVQPYTTLCWTQAAGDQFNEAMAYFISDRPFGTDSLGQKQNGYEFNIEEGRLENWIQN